MQQINQYLQLVQQKGSCDLIIYRLLCIEDTIIRILKCGYAGISLCCTVVFEYALVMEVLNLNLKVNHRIGKSVQGKTPYLYI